MAKKNLLYAGGGMHPLIPLCIRPWASRLLIRDKIRSLKVEHLKFEGYMTQNKDEYQKFCPAKTLASEYHNSLLVIWLHAY